MTNNEINVTEETKEAVEGVAKAGMKAGGWVIGGIILAGGALATILGIKHAKKKKAMKAKQEEAESKDWTEELDETVQVIKDENID